MSTRRSLKQPVASLKNSLKKNPKYREMLRRAARKFHLESLEDRRVYAIDPVLVQADGGVAFGTGTAPMTVRNESPRELTFTFPAVPGIDRTTLTTGIKLVGANKDGAFNANDITYTPAYLDLGNDPTQVVMRFATPLPDDLYRIQFIGSALKDTDGLPFNLGATFNVDFRLNLAPQITAIVPQPIERNALTGQLTQRANQVDVYFNNDDLDPARATDPQYYKLLVTRGTVDPLDDAPSGVEIAPSSVFYDPAKDKVILTFSANIESFAPVVAGVADPAVAYRLRIGTNEIRRPNVYGVTAGGATTDYLTTDPGSTFDGAANLKNVLARGLTSPQTLESFINQSLNSTANTNVLTSGTSVIIGQSIDAQYYNLMWPGGNDDPGHRDIHSGNHGGTGVVIAPLNRTQTFIAGNDIVENHLAAAADSVNGVTTYYYNFRSELGYVPDTTTGTITMQPTFNIITERQKQRAREVLELLGQYSGVNFVETEQQGFIIATGDMRSILTTVQTGAGGLTGLSGFVDLNNDGIPETAAAIMDSGEDWAANGGDLYGNAWFVTAMHEVQEVLGLGHSYDLPGLTVQGYDPDLSLGLPAPEPVFPGDADIVHMQHVYRPESKDIDLFKFELDQAGVFTAEVFAERLANSSQLDSALSIYRVNPQTQQPELYARNDDYFSKDAFIELELGAGTYFIGVSASGNIEYDPNVFDSGMGGTTQGVYQLKLDFRKVAAQTLTDNSGIAGAAGTAFDGDSDGKPGGVHNFWFRAAAPVSNLADLQSTTRTARTIYVDRAGGGNSAAIDVSPRDGDPDSAGYVPDGSLAKPFLSIKRALEASKPFDIIRIVGNNLAATPDTTDTDLTNNLAYQIGFDRLGLPLADGSTLDVPKDRTVMFDAGAVVQLRRAQISVGSENQGASADRSGGALQVLGTPWQNVYFTSFNDVNTALPGEVQIGKDENVSADKADEGDWGGIAFRNDIDKADGRFDFERRGIFVNYISNADIRYGGGQVVVNSTARTVNPIHLTDARPTIVNNRITFNADAAMSANPDSFEESNFSSPQYGSTFNTSFNVDYNRVGPEIHGNILLNNTVNALSIRARTQSGALNVNSLEEMTVAGRFDDTDIVHVIQENLVMHSNPGGALVHSSLSAPGTTLTVAAPTTGVGGFAAGSQSQIEYKIVYIDENGNEGLASNTVKVTGTLTAANSYIRLTNLPNVTASLLAQGFVGRRLYRRIGLTGDFVLVEQIPASSSSTYIDKNIALPASALRLKVAAVTDSISPRIAAVGALPAVTATAQVGTGQYAAGTRVVYGLAWVDTEGRDSPMVELPLAGNTLGPNGRVTLNNLPAVYGQYMGLRVYRSIAGGQFDLLGMVDAGANSFIDTGAPVTPAQAIPSTVDITATISAIPPPAGQNGFMNGQIVNYRFTYFGAAGETASSALAVPAGETKGFVITGNNRQITINNLPDIDDKQFSFLLIYRSINYGTFELVDFKTLAQQLTPAGFTFLDTNGPPLGRTLADATLSPPMTARARPHGTLVIDPSIVVKSDGARIDATIGTSIIAEGVKGRSIVMTSLYDQRYGAGGTFATSKSTGTAGEAGDWAGIYFAPDAKGSFNEVVFAYGGGENRIEGTFTGINVLEIQGAKVRVANSRFEFNADGISGDQAPVDRSGRGPNDNATIFVRGAQPVIINNVVVNNQGSFISVNANGMNSFNQADYGRQTGLLAELPAGGLTRVSYPVSRLTDTQTAVTDVDNNGPLIRLNKLDQNEVNGMRVRGGVLTTETVWDDTDIAHVLFDSILIPDFHTFGGLRLESGARESLVIKAASNVNAGTVAGFIANGRPLEIEDRIGGTLQVLGQPGFPVQMTSFSDDTISAGLTPSGKPQANTNGDALLPPLPTIGEVNNGLTIDNDVATTVNGYFSYGVNNAGAYTAATGSRVTAQGVIANYVNQDLLTEHFPLVLVGNTYVDLNVGVTVPAFLNGPDEVVSEGEFAGSGGNQIHWKSTSKFQNGSTRLTTTFQFNAVTGTLGSIRLVDYLDQNIGLANNDLLYLFGSPGQADFRLLTLDNTDRIGFAQGGVYAPGAGLQNAKYIGFGADKSPDLRAALTGGTYTAFALTANPTGGPTNIDPVDMPLVTDRALGNVYGLNNVTSAMAWDVSPNASSSLITTFVELFPRSPVVAGRPGEWNGIVIDKYANDRNVETVPEREPVSSNGAQNSRPSKAQFLGSLAGANKGGDENLRLGFVVQGAISTVSDVDIYSFKAKSETEVWFDVDRTSQALDSVIELVDEFGNVLARSDNSVDEAGGADSLIGEGALRLQKTEPYEGLDLYSTNVRDPGMRIKLPGPPGVESTYFVRVRSVPRNKVDLDTAVPQSVNESLVTSGVSYGAYELQIRLREKDEKGGTTVRYAKIANATTGIDVNGHPTHSPLGGERRDLEPNDVGSLLGAQNLGNLLTVDRGAIAVGGNLSAYNDVDWYRFSLDYTEVDGTNPVQKEYPSLQSLVNTVFDLDYADGLGRANLQMFVYNSNFELILSSRDSNVADDRSSAVAGSSLSDLNRGSTGYNDSYIGNISLPATTPFSSGNGAAPQTYYVAVTSIGTIPQVMDQFTNAASANPLLRLEPLDSVHRIVEDHIDEGLWPPPLRRHVKPEIGTDAPDRGTSSRPDQEILFDNISPGVPGADSSIPWTLNDVSLYISRDIALAPTAHQTTIGTIDRSVLQTFNPFTGNHMTTVGQTNFEIEDIDFNAAGLLYGLTTDTDPDGLPLEDLDSGHFVDWTTTNGTGTDHGDDGIITYELDPTGAIVQAHLGPGNVRYGYGIHYDALSFFNPGGSPTQQRVLGVGRRGEAFLPGNVNPVVAEKTNIVYQLDAATGRALADPNQPRIDGAATDAIEMGVILTEQRFTAVEATDTTSGAATLNYRPLILDGTQFSLSDGQVTQVFEFNAGYEAVQTINNTTDQTVRDGYFFILDDDTDPTNKSEKIFQYDTGAVIAVRRLLNSGQIPDGSTFTINTGVPGGSLAFEFDNDGNQNNPNSVQIDISTVGPTLTADVIATLIAQAINSQSDPQTFPAFASVTPGSTRVSLIPDTSFWGAGVFVDATIFDPGLLNNGNITVQGATGAAPVLQAVSSPAAGPGSLEGQYFTLQVRGLQTTFEFDPQGNGVSVPGRVAVNVGYNQTSDQVALAMTNAINGVTDYTATRFGDRVMVNGALIRYIYTPTQPIVDLMDTVANGGLGGLLITAEEDYSNQQLMVATTSVVNGPSSPFSAGGEASIRTGRINFPPVEIPGLKVSTQRLDATGMPLWSVLASTPDYSPGTVSIPFFADDDRFATAQRVEAAIDGNVNGFNATVSGFYVTLDRGQITLPNGSPFTVAGEGPGGNVTGIVNVGNSATTATFVAVSDKGGLYLVTVNHQNNLALLSNNTVSTIYIGGSENDLKGIKFQGVTRGPANVENGRYADTWFAVADSGPFIVGPTVNFNHAENNNQIGQATATGITAGGGSTAVLASGTGVIGDGPFGTTTGDYDFYSIGAGAGQTLTITLDAAGAGSGTLADSYMTLYDANGTIVAFDDNGGVGLDSQIVYNVGTAGTYYLAVRGGGFNGDLQNPFLGNTGRGATFTGTYGLTITKQEYSSSRLYAFEYAPGGAYTGLQPIFVDGESNIALTYRSGNVTLPISDAKGIHFSELDQNLWHFTDFNLGPRAADPGHGTPANENGSRSATEGHASYYFGAGTYNFNNGAYGSIVSNEFSLEGYSAIDQPVLYFTYYSEHEQSAYDSFRVFISGINDENADRDADGRSDTNSGDWWPLSFDDQTVVPVVNEDIQNTYLNVPVQPNFTNTNSWRQVRIPLDRFAGWKDLRLRMDFSTAGDMDLGTPYTTGEELRTVAGQYITDGQFVSIDGQIYELDSGISATFASGNAVTDGETITVTGAGGAVNTFEFDKDNTFTGGNIRVPIHDLMTAIEVTQSLLGVLQANGYGGEVSYLGNDAVLNFFGSQDVVVGAPVGVTPTTILEGAVGLTQPGAIEVLYQRAWSKIQVADSFNAVLEREFYDQKLIVGNGSQYVDGQTYTLTDVNDPLATQTFEVETGILLTIPVNGANNLFPATQRVNDQDTFSLTFDDGVTVVTQVFEYDSDTIVTTPGAIGIPFNVNDTQSQIATITASIINQTFTGATAQVVSNSRVQLDTDTTLTTSMTYTPSAIPAVANKYPTTGNVGVSDPAFLPIFITQAPLFSPGQVSARVATAINASLNLPGLVATTAITQPNRVTLVSANEYIIGAGATANVTLELINVVANNNIKQYGDLIRLISSPTGPQHTVDIDPLTLVPFRGPFGWESILPGDVGDLPPGPLALNGFRSNLRGQNNSFEGVFVDDFVIGLAERGEMATQSNANSATVTQAPLALPDQIRTGDYTLEIRRGVGYDFVDLENPTFTADSNDRFTGQQTILARSGADIIDGQTFTISDGNRQLTFEYNDIFEFNPTGDVVTPGNQEIPFHSGMKDYEVAEAIRDAINRVDVQQIISVNAWLGDGVQPGLATTTNRVNLNGAATFVATGVPVVERNESIATALPITAPGVVYDGLRFFANGEIGDSDDSVTSQLDQARRDRDIDYFGLDLVAGQRIIVDIDAATTGSTLDSYLRIFNDQGTLQNVTINGVTYTAENDDPLVPMLFPGGTFSTVTYTAPGERGGAAVINNTASSRPNLDSALDFIAPVAGRYYIGVSGASNNRYNPIDSSGAIPGTKGTYTLEITSPNAPGNNSAGVNSAVDVITYDSEIGDTNIDRDQGQIILQGNEIYNSAGFGIDIDAGARTALDNNAAHQGGVRNLAQSNALGLVPGVVVMNNVIYGNGLGGIRFSGDPITDAPVPYGRIVNNTLYGQGGTLNPPIAAVADTGILITERAGPTLLNNIIVNFDTGIAVDASSRPTTVIGGIVTQGNGTLSNPANVGFGDFPILLSDTRLANGTLRDPLFRNPVGANFYLDPLSRAIDSSVDSLLDRPLMVTIKAPLGLGESPILSPDRDSRGQVRADDPDVQTPQGFGLNPFKDRGAIDRVDKIGPSSDLINPQDNDSFGIDRDSADNVVSTDNTAIVRNFTVALFDRTDPNGEPDGSDIDDFTVTTSQVIVTRRTSPTTESVLVDGVDYFFSYDSTSNQIVLTPVGNVWVRGTYRIYLNDGILDQAGNTLSPNNSVALVNPVLASDTITHYYDVFLGTAVDYGDAPANYPVLDADNGANHFITPGVYLGNAPTADFDGKPSTAATLDSDDGVVSFGSLLPGSPNASTVTVMAPTSGIKLSMWIDNDGVVGWNDTTERVITNYVLTAGSNTINFTIPAGSRGATYARLRVSSVDINSAVGPAIDGEVEDYQVTLTGPLFQNPNPIIKDINDNPDQGLVNIGNMDVNNDGKVTAFDAIIVINYLNLYPMTTNLPIVGGQSPLAAPPPYLDVDGNGRLESPDARIVINFLNANPIRPPGAPEFVSVGGGSAPESAGESVEAEAAPEGLALNLLLPGELYASSSIILESQPFVSQEVVSSQAAGSPVEEMMNAAALEAAILAMGERQVAVEELSLEVYQDVEIPNGPLTDGQWADLLDELALEQIQQS